MHAYAEVGSIEKGASVRFAIRTQLLFFGQPTRSAGDDRNIFSEALPDITVSCCRLAKLYGYINCLWIEGNQGSTIAQVYLMDNVVASL